MRVLVSGATGFVGRALVLRLRRDGHRVLGWVRSEERARGLLGAEVELLSTAAPQAALAQALAGCDAAVNLAGAAIAWPRWSEHRKRILVDSRVALTHRLVESAAGAARLRTFVSASAVGFYGDRGDELLDEESCAGDDFLAQLCRQWEAAALRNEAQGRRVVLLRSGIVLGRGGGVLAKVLPLFRAGLGGRLGSGRQYVPWIHLHDLVELIAAALVEEQLRGPMNATAGLPVRNRDFTRALGRALHRPAFIPVPRFALRWVLGEAAAVLLNSARVRPKRLEELGFAARFAQLDEAFADLIGISV